jgi:hypothetical protein
MIKVAYVAVLILTCHTLNFTYFTGQDRVSVENAMIDPKSISITSVSMFA